MKWCVLCCVLGRASVYGLISCSVGHRSSFQLLQRSLRLHGVCVWVVRKLLEAASPGKHRCAFHAATVGKLLALKRVHFVTLAPHSINSLRGVCVCARNKAHTQRGVIPPLWCFLCLKSLRRQNYKLEWFNPDASTIKSVHRGGRRGNVACRMGQFCIRRGREVGGTLCYVDTVRLFHTIKHLPMLLCLLAGASGLKVLTLNVLSWFCLLLGVTKQLKDYVFLAHFAYTCAPVTLTLISNITAEIKG